MVMFQHRRPPGGTYFFTARLRDPQSDLLVREINHLRAATRATIKRFPFQIEAVAVLPSALHTVWKLPDGDADYASRWSMLKALFARGLPDAAEQMRHGAASLWAPRLTEHPIKTPGDLAAHINYVHATPVQAGLVGYPREWQHSSIHRAAAAKVPPDARGPVPAQQAEGSMLVQPL